MSNDRDNKSEGLLEIAADIVSAYVSNNSVPASELASLIGNISATLDHLSKNISEQAHTRQTPAVNPKRSVHDAYIICLEDGKSFRSLKRHLSAHHGMTAEEYRSKWNLPPDYPMAAPGYSAARSELAKELGLGRKRAAPAPAKQARKASQKAD